LLEKASESFKSIYLALRLTGARPNELTRAQICEFDRVAQEIVLQRHKTARKTGESRRLAVGHESLKEIIRTAIGQRTEGPIFERVPGREWTVDQLSAEYRRARDAAGIRKGLVLYCSRHEHGTALYKATGDLKAVADSLGHKSLSTTMRYTRADGDQLKKNQSLFDDTL
jgi:integrase